MTRHPNPSLLTTSLRRALRGYFAPLHPAPWRAAWAARASFTGAVSAWFSALGRLTDGGKP